MRTLLVLFAGSLFPAAAMAFTPPTPRASLLPSTQISQVCDFYRVIQVAASWVLVIGLIIGVLFVVWGGVKYITAEGEESKTEDAKKIIIGSLVGVVFLILAIALIKIIASFFGETTFDISLTTAPC